MHLTVLTLSTTTTTTIPTPYGDGSTCQQSCFSLSPREGKDFSIRRSASCEPSQWSPQGPRDSGKEATPLVADTEGKRYHLRWFTAPAKATRSYKGHPPPSAMLIYKPNHSYPASAHVEDPALVQVHPDHRATGKIPIEQPFVKPGGGKGTPTQGLPKRKRLRKDKETCELMETEFCVECTEECMSCDSPRITTSAYFTNRVTVILSATSSHVVCQTNLYPKGARS